MSTKKYIKIGTTGDFPPFTIRKQSKSLEGFDIEIMNRFATENNLHIEWVLTSWSSFTNDLLSEAFDVAVGGITLTDARKEKFICSSPIIENGKVPLIHQDNIDKFNSPTAMNKKDVIVVYNPGGTNADFAKSFLQNATHLETKDIEGIFIKLRTKEADLFVTDLLEALHREQQFTELVAINPSHPLTDDQFGYLFNQGQISLSKLFNAWFSRFVPTKHFTKLLHRFNISIKKIPLKK